MNVIDSHCDALYKLQIATRNAIPLSFTNAQELQTNFRRLKKGKVRLQFFAIFIDPTVKADESWHAALEQIELFQTEILGKHPEIKQIKHWQQIDTLAAGEIGAILTLEGAEPIGNDLAKLQTLYDLGIMSIGLTWNDANLCADGIREPRGAGLTLLGKEIVRLNNRQHVLTDVSHLSVQAFWDVMEIADYPIASHSNAKRICDHPRNLDDAQIKSLIQKNAPIHLVFYPEFVKKTNENVMISDFIKHIDYICSLGGVNHIGFGSDFDGIDTTIVDLENSSHYPNLINELLKCYSEKEVRGFASENFVNFIQSAKM